MIRVALLALAILSVTIAGTDEPAQDQLQVGPVIHPTN